MRIMIIIIIITMMIIIIMFQQLFISALYIILDYSILYYNVTPNWAKALASSARLYFSSVSSSSSFCLGFADSYIYIYIYI